MFKNYLRVLPSGVQLCIFIMFSTLLMLVLSYSMPLLIHNLTGSNMSIEDFLKQGAKQYPLPFIIINELYLIFTFLLPSVIFAYLAHPQPAGYLGLRQPQPRTHILFAIIMAVGMLLSITTLASWMHHLNLGKWADSLQEDRNQFEDLFLNNNNTTALFIKMSLVSIVPAFCEELFFRGIAMRFLNTWVKKPWISIVISASLFAVIHFSVYNFVPILVTGILLGWLYFNTSSVWLTILVHFIFNGSQVLISYLYKDIKQDTQSLMSQLLYFTLGAALIAIAIYFIRKSRNPLPNNWGVVERDINIDNPKDILKQENN